jgi:hypothetical protein
LAVTQLTDAADLEARVERLERLLLPAPRPGVDSDDDDGALHTGQDL